LSKRTRKLSAAAVIKIQGIAVFKTPTCVLPWTSSPDQNHQRVHPWIRMG
jgi:hypothetical protein